MDWSRTPRSGLLSTFGGCSPTYLKIRCKLIRSELPPTFRPARNGLCTLWTLLTPVCTELFPLSSPFLPRSLSANSCSGFLLLPDSGRIGAPPCGLCGQPHLLFLVMAFKRGAGSVPQGAFPGQDEVRNPVPRIAHMHGARPLQLCSLRPPRTPTERAGTAAAWRPPARTQTKGGQERWT